MKKRKSKPVELLKQLVKVSCCYKEPTVQKACRYISLLKEAIVLKSYPRTIIELSGVAKGTFPVSNSHNTMAKLKTSAL